MELECQEVTIDDEANAGASQSTIIPVEMCLDLVLWREVQTTSATVSKRLLSLEHLIFKDMSDSELAEPSLMLKAQLEILRMSKKLRAAIAIIDLIAVKMVSSLSLDDVLDGDTAQTLKLWLKPLIKARLSRQLLSSTHSHIYDTFVGLVSTGNKLKGDLGLNEQR